MISTCSFLSFEAIEQDLRNYIQARPAYASFVDFYESGIGETFVQLIAGSGAMYNYRIDNIRKEIYLPDAVLKSSIYKIAQSLQYNPHRKLAPILNITVDVTAPITLTRGDVVGTLGNYNLVVENTIILGVGVNQQFNVLVGDWETKTEIVATSKDWHRIQFGSENYQVASNLVGKAPRFVFVTINGTQLDVVLYREGVQTNSQVLLLTDPDGDARLEFGDGFIGRKVEINDTVEILWLDTPGETLDASVLALTSSNAEFTILPLQAGDIISLGQNEESVIKVANLANTFWQTLNRSVTIYDNPVIAEKYPLFQNVQIRETPNVRCELDIAYIQVVEDNLGAVNVMTPLQKQGFLDYMDFYRIGGIKINIIDPIRKEVDWDITVVHDTSANTIQMTTDIENIIKDFTIKLGKSLLVGSLLKDWLEKVTGVQRIYISYPFADKALDFGNYYKSRNLVINFNSDAESLHKFESDTDPGFDGYV